MHKHPSKFPWEYQSNCGIRTPKKQKRNEEEREITIYMHEDEDNKNRVYMAGVQIQISSTTTSNKLCHNFFGKQNLVLIERNFNW